MSDGLCLDPNQSLRLELVREALRLDAGSPLLVHGIPLFVESMEKLVLGHGRESRPSTEDKD